MKLRGGYNLWLAGRPGRSVEVLPEPDVLHLPTWSERFTFTVPSGTREISAGSVVEFRPWRPLP